MTDTPHNRQGESANGRAGASRRSVLTTLGGGALTRAASGLAAYTAQGKTPEAQAPQAPAGSAPLAAACVLTPEQMEGPYYLDLETVRKNITEGEPGARLTGPWPRSVR